MHFVDVITQVPSTKLNTNMAMAVVGMYSGEFEQLNLHSGQPLVCLQRELPGYAHLDPYNWKDFEVPDTYAILAINNTAETQIRMTVSGLFRVLRS